LASPSRYAFRVLEVARHRPRAHSDEAELKFRLGQAEHARLRNRLRDLQARSMGSYDEENIRFRPHRQQPVSLRLRILDGGPAGILTAKAPARFERRIKIREETEVAVADADTTRELLVMLGHRVAFTYHKHRETWRLDGVDVTLDTLDFGAFCEVEGPVDQIEDVARTLGLDPKRALKSSYSALARAFNRKRRS
jgi:predicted adenylyl cyclase CyaB